jgi:hypothetical protein
MPSGSQFVMVVAQQTEIVSEVMRQMIDYSEQGMRARLLSVDIDERGKQPVDDVDLDLSAVETILGETSSRPAKDTAAAAQVRATHLP